MNRTRAVFLDRDGTIIEERDYLSDPAGVVLFAGAAQALRKLQDAGLLLFIVTNQSGIGRGYYTLDDMFAVNRRVLELLAEHGVDIRKVYFAPEAPEQPSRGRKPSPQFVFDARDEFNLDLAHSYFIGDKISDVECGWNADLRMSLLVRTGYGADAEKKLQSKARCFCGDTLSEAVAWILADLSK